MKLLLSKVAENVAAMRAEHKSLSKEHGDVKVGEVTVGQVLGGMRGIPALLCDTSTVMPDEGLRIRNIPILELTNERPEDIFFLLLTGQKPNDEEKEEMTKLFNSHSSVPFYVWNVLEAMGTDAHPMAMLNTALIAMERESKFRAAYEAGAGKDQLWKYMLEDSIILLSRITTVAAGIYRMRFGKGERIAPRKDLDWSANFAYMLGADGDGDFSKLIRMYLVLHSDHEAGNVSAATCHTVGSALSDAYYAVSAGLNGLAGPLHGLANQECLRYLLDIYHKFGDRVPTEEELTKGLWEHLNTGHVVPGYGHAVLRVQDPRFTAFYNFAKEYCGDDDVTQLMDLLYKVAPKVLTEQGKAKNVWPNVDAASGALLYYYGMREFQYYTVMFAVSRAMGLTAQLTLNRAILSPIVRPNALTTERLEEIVKGA